MANGLSVSYKNQIINKIEEEFQNQPDQKKNITRPMVKILLDLRTKGTSPQLSDAEFFDIVGMTFKLNPGFFMKRVYENFMKKMSKLIGLEKLYEMERHIIEKYCLAENEKIIYELNGIIGQREPTDIGEVKISINPADIFITNKKIIGHGQLKASGAMDHHFLTEFSWGKSRQKERKQALVESSPVFGYEFPTKNPLFLIKTKKRIIYSVYINKLRRTFVIQPTDKSKRGQHISNFFDILRKDVDQTVAVIKEIYESEREILKMQTETLNMLKLVLGKKSFLVKSEEFTHFSDSDRIKVILETYKLDSEYFMNSIYPKMASWDFPSFLSLKEELFELLRKEGASI